jgi:DNA (cytosine-5)-methyltransferase 1
MVGNAIPPSFTYLVANAALRVKPKALVPFARAGAALTVPEELPSVTAPDREGRSYPAGRRFRSAIPHLRFKSGMRFDFSNDFTSGHPVWRTNFYFGPSKDIRQVDLDGELLSFLKRTPLVSKALRKCGPDLEQARQVLRGFSSLDLQQVWTRRAKGVGPFQITDLLGSLADCLHERLETQDHDLTAIQDLVCSVAGDESEIEFDLPGRAKLRRNALRILSGFVVGSWFNSLVEDKKGRIAA